MVLPIVLSLFQFFSDIQGFLSLGVLGTVFGGWLDALLDAGGEGDFLDAPDAGGEGGLLDAPPDAVVDAVGDLSACCEP